METDSSKFHIGMGFGINHNSGNYQTDAEVVTAFLLPCTLASYEFGVPFGFSPRSRVLKVIPLKHLALL